MVDPFYDPFIDSDGVRNCYLGSFAFLVVHVILSYLSSKSVAIQIAEKDREKQKYGFVFIKENDKMSSRKMWSLMIGGFIGGFSVGLFGIGSYVMVMPTLYSLGIDYDIAVFTSIPITFFASMIMVCLSWLSGLYGALTTFAIVLIFFLSIISTIVVDCLIRRALKV